MEKEALEVKKAQVNEKIKGLATRVQELDAARQEYINEILQLNGELRLLKELLEEK